MGMRSVLLLALAGLPASSATAVELYVGKQIELVVGSGPSGGYDTYGRLLARHLPRDLPGNPTVVVQNMPGAASPDTLDYMKKLLTNSGGG